MTDYSPTVNPGDTRVRAHTINTFNALNAFPRVDIQEHKVIKTKDGSEAVLENLGFFTVYVDPQELQTPYPIRDPVTDVETGETDLPYKLLQSYYSWVRAKQLARDAKVATPPVTPG